MSATQWQKWWLGSLWAGWLLSLTGSLIAGRWGDEFWRRARLDLRAASCLVLALAAVMSWWQLLIVYGAIYAAHGMCRTESA